MLASAGFGGASSMEGGIHAWEGLTAAGPPEAGMSFFPATAGPGELIALAWLLEDGSRKFYASCAGAVKDSEAAKLFADLTGAEEHHQAALRDLYRHAADRQPGPDFPRSVVQADEDRMEGGMQLSAALAWAAGRDSRELLELSLALEADSYDLYIKMGRRVEGTEAKKVFGRLVEEEKEHLARMAALLDRKL